MSYKKKRTDLQIRSFVKGKNEVEQRCKTTVHLYIHRAE